MHYPWRKHLKARLRKRQPARVTVEWLQENRWWWRGVEQAIARHVDEDLKPRHASERVRFIAWVFRTWRYVQLSAFLHELGRRCQKKKPASWLELPDKEIMRLLHQWPDKYTTAGHDTPLICQPFEPGKEWMFEPVKTHKTRQEVLWNKNEPAWTEPYIVTANLNVGDNAILNQFKEWLAEERKRTGIASPRGGSTQGIGKGVWRFCEILDRKNAGLRLDEGQHSLASKAVALWRAVQNPSPPFTREFYLRVALRDIPKHGRILESSLPPVSSRPR